MEVPRRKVRGEAIDTLDLFPPLKLCEPIQFRLPHLGLLLHKRVELFPLAQTAAPFGFIAHHKMRHRFSHPPRFQCVFQLLRRHLSVVVCIDRPFNLCDEFTSVDLRRVPQKLRSLLIRQILLGCMNMAFEHVGRTDAAIVDQFETRPLPRTTKLYAWVIGITHPASQVGAVLRTNRDVPPMMALVIDRNITLAELVKFGTTQHVPEVRARPACLGNVQREVLPSRNIGRADRVRQTAFDPHRFANVRERLLGLLLAFRGHIGHALRLHLDPARTLRITYRYKLQPGLHQFLVGSGNFAHQFGSRLDFQKWFVFVVQFFRTRATLIDEVLQVRPRENF
ncbi:hypothetical protein WL99_10500 [Burkholderia cepacia]|nr:hypothetical protein WL99_10500 [Burkholderia cepacia]